MSTSYSLRLRSNPNDLEGVVDSRGVWTGSPQDFVNKLCGVKVAEQRRLAQHASLEQAHAFWKDKPWLTPIIGSGALGMSPVLLRVAPFLADAVADKVAQLPAFNAATGNFAGRGQDERDWTREFVAQLVQQRAGADDADPGELPTPVDIDDVALHFIVLAAATSRLFHRISLDSSRPLGRWGGGEVRLPGNHVRAGQTREEHGQLVVHLLDACLALLKQDPGRLPTQLKSLLQATRNDVEGSDVRVKRLHLEQLTEIAWYLLAGSVDEASYPGWTELLIRLVLNDDRGVDRAYRRPRVRELSGLADQLWAMHRCADQNTPESTRRFYESVASALWEQHLTRGIPSPDQRKLNFPWATAFVVSFDQELVRAMVTTAPAGCDEFVVALPVFSHKQGDDNGDFVWLEGVVHVPSAKRRIAEEGSAPQGDGRRPSPFQPESASWKAWTLKRRREQLRENAPVLVHLVGAPWVELPLRESSSEPSAIEGPEPGNLLRQSLGDGLDSGQLRLSPAIALDEYQALFLSAIELGGEDRQLPVDYLSGDHNAPTRTWALFGVPFRDPAVRTRVLSILARRPSSRQRATATRAVGDELASAPAVVAAGLSFGDTRRPAPPAAEPVDSEGQQLATDWKSAGDDDGLRGIAVGLRLEDEEVSILFEMGLTVVRDRSEAFTDDVSAYAGWLRESRETYMSIYQAERPI